MAVGGEEGDAGIGPRCLHPVAHLWPSGNETGTSGIISQLPSQVADERAHQLPPENFAADHAGASPGKSAIRARDPYPIRPLKFPVGENSLRIAELQIG